MRVLEVTPLGTFSGSFRVTAEGREITCLDIARLRDSGAFELAGIPYRLEREGTFRGRYSLVERERVIARAERKGFLRPWYQVTAGDRLLVLRQRGFFGSLFTVEQNRASLGTIRRRGFIHRIATATLDDKIPLPCQMLLLFLALVQWRRQARRSA